MLSRPFRPPLLKRRNSDESEQPPTKKVKVESTGLVFKKPGISILPRKPLLEVSNTTPIAGVTGIEGYYSVLWRNVTKKKHKTWEGDALLYVNSDGFAELYHGETARSMGKAKCSEPLLPGSSLFIAGKDIEIEHVLSKAQYMAHRRVPAVKDGRKDDQAKTMTRPAAKPVTLKIKQQAPASTDLHPKLAYASKTSLTPNKKTAKRRDSHDTSGPKAVLETPKTNSVPTSQHMPPPSDALVMKRPTDAKVDVVVDRILSSKMREHQREGVKFLYECVMGLRDFNGRGAILADEMGLGKTLQTIALLWTLLKQSPYEHGTSVIKKALIICPATLINNWRKEIRKWLGLDRIGVLVADAKTRISHFTHGKSYNVMIVSYERLRIIQAELAKGQGVDIIVADEAHRLKTAKNKSLQAINALSTERKIFLTGTPVQNDLGEFYMMVDSVNPGVLGLKKAFTRDLEIPIGRGRQPAASSEDVEQGEECNRELIRLTSPFILRRTADVLARYLPMKTEHVLLCKPTKSQASLYRHILGNPAFHAASLGNSDCSLQLITLLKKVCNSPALLQVKAGMDSSHEAKVNGDLLADIPPNLLRNNAGSTKLRMLDTLLHTLRTTTTEKVVLVSNYTSTLDLLGRLLTSVGHTFSRIDGSTPSSKRQEIIDDFNRSPAETCFAFLLSAKAGGLGINLIGASRLVLFDVDWNPATDLQAMARIHRDGQKRACFIYRFLMAGGIEEKIFQRQIVKLGLANNVVDQKEESSSFTKEDLKDLFHLHEGLSCQTHDLIGCRCQGRGTEMGGGIDEDAQADSDLPTLADIVNSSMAEDDQQGSKAKVASRVARDALMSYTHIETADFGSGGGNDKEALVKDDVLLKTLKDEGNSVSFVFSRVQL
ncbi:MAG: hypothetical protein LQ337_003180 [Flavoplaca oasis]|nr:MAG: hypothetical protein LQ337_003180 [Flavoplaca oasis]